jgi:hypothetical protein
MTKTPQVVVLTGLLFALAVTPAAAIPPGSKPRRTSGKLAFRAGLREHAGSKLEILQGIKVRVYRGHTLIATVSTRRVWAVIRAKAGSYRLVWQKWHRGRYVFESTTLVTKVEAGQFTYASMNYTT